MAKKYIKFTLDTIDSNYSPVGTVKQLDSVFFYIKITENGVTKDLTGQTIKLFAIKGDKKLVEQTTKINTTNETEGLVEIELLNSAIQVPGFTYFELEISDNTGIISTSDFILRVDRKVGSDEAIESTNEVATLKEIEIYVAQAKVELQRFKELQTEMLRTNETINSNEEERVLAEEKRVSAENKRALAEEERGTLFTKKEEERGTLFAQKELDRNNTFVQGERERNERFEEAERNRAVAENERVIAEQARAEKFAGFESKISANTKELEGARTATTGEEFNSLDERIDCEVDRLNKKIEVSMLQQESAESHVVENTVEGMTTDMVVKGKTLVNIVKSHRRICAKGASAYFQLIYPKLKAGTYTVILNASELTKEGITMYDMINSVQYPYGLKTGLNIRKIDVREEGSTYAVIVGNDNVDGTQFMLESLMIIEGDWTNKPLPQYFEGIKSFGQQEDKISILSYTGNLLDIDLSSPNVEDGVYYHYVSGAKVVNNDVFTSSIKLPANTRYSLFNINRHVSYWVGSEFKGSVKNNFTDNVFTTQVSPPYDCTLKVTVFKVNKNSAYCTLGDNKLTPWQPYKEPNKKDILLQDLGFDEGLRGLSPTACDELNSIRNMAVKKIEKYVFTGNENISLHDTQTDTISFRYFNDNHDSSWLDSNNLICTSLLSIGHKIYESNNEGISSDNVGFIFRINKSKLTTLDIEGFKAWLRTNQTIVYYKLKEPVETPLNEDINLETFGERTYVSFENSISGTSSFKVPVNTIAAIARLNRENRALEEENVKLKENMIKQTIYFENEDKKMTDYTLDIDFKMCLMEMNIEDIKANLGGDINAKK